MIVIKMEDGKIYALDMTIKDFTRLVIKGACEENEYMFDILRSDKPLTSAEMKELERRYALLDSIKFFMRHISNIRNDTICITESNKDYYNAWKNMLEVTGRD